MLIESVVVSLVVGKVRGGTFGALGNFSLRQIYLFIIAFIIEFVLVYGGRAGISFLREFAPYFYFAAYVLLFVGLWSNRDKPEMWIIAVGAFLNALVIFVNGGRMPISPDAMIRAGMGSQLDKVASGNIVTYSLLEPETLLKPLADVIAVGKPYPFPHLLSVGDLAIAVGVFILIQRGMMVGRIRDH